MSQIKEGKLFVSSSTLICDKDAQIVANTMSLGVEPGITVNVTEAATYANELVRRWNAFEQQPTAGEMTTEIRNALKTQTRLNRKQEKKAIAICGRLDRAEAENRRLKKAIEDYGNNPAGFDWAVLEKIETQESINKDLLGLCEEFMKKADNGAADFDDPEPGSIYLRASAAIAKAKKEG